MEARIPNGPKARDIFSMRVRSRIMLFLSLGLLLIGIVVLVAVPYLNHLVYPDSLPRSAARRATGYAVIPEDRQVDELGAPDNIRTEADAMPYVVALVKEMGPRGNESPSS